MCFTQVIAQANTFTLAGYETTANTLSYCVYNIAAHPEAQQRLLEEVDAYGRHRKVEYKDMDQVGGGGSATESGTAAGGAQSSSMWH